MTGPICTPLDSGGIWCQASFSVGDGGLNWQTILLVYLVALLVTWTGLAASPTRS